MKITTKENIWKTYNYPYTIVLPIVLEKAAFKRDEATVEEIPTLIEASELNLKDPQGKSLLKVLGSLVQQDIKYMRDLGLFINGSKAKTYHIITLPIKYRSYTKTNDKLLIANLQRLNLYLKTDKNLKVVIPDIPTKASDLTELLYKYIDKSVQSQVTLCK